MIRKARPGVMADVGVVLLSSSSQGIGRAPVAFAMGVARASSDDS